MHIRLSIAGIKSGDRSLFSGVVFFLLLLSLIHFVSSPKGLLAAVQRGFRGGEEQGEEHGNVRNRSGYSREDEWVREVVKGLGRVGLAPSHLAPPFSYLFFKCYTKGAPFLLPRPRLLLFLLLIDLDGGGACRAVQRSSR